jgi:hypothetical protein
MRVSIVVLDESRHARSAGTERPALPSWVIGLVTRLVREHDVTVITDHDDAGLPDTTAVSRRWVAGSLHRRQIARARSGDPLSDNVIRSMADRIGQIDADVVHAVGQVAGRVVESMGWDAPAPLVWSPGDRAALPTRGPSVPHWTPLRAEAVLASTTVELDDLVRRGVSRDRARCVPLRVWPSVAELGQPIGTRVRVRRVCCLLDDDSSGALAMVRALSRLPHMRLLVVGRDGVDRSRTSARDVALLARHLHVDGRVGVLTDASDSALQLAMREADVVTLLSPAEPDLAALGASLVSGAVPVVLAGTGAEEIVEHGVSGVCVRSLDPRQLGSALRILDQDPDVRDTMAIAARRRAREVYEPDTLARTCVESYRAAQRSRIPGARSAPVDLDRGLEVSV